MNREERNKYTYSLIHKILEGKEYKKCSTCNEWKELNDDNFYTTKYSNDGFLPSCKECTKETNKKRKKDNYDTYYRPKQKEWNDANKDHRKELNQEFELKNPGRKKEIHDDFIKEHPERQKEYSKKREKKNHIISSREWIACKDYFGNCCAYCDLPIEEHWIIYKGVKKLGDFHREHKDDQGANDLSNCLPSCESCNSKKWKFGFDEWYTPDNPVFSQDRLDKINEWLNEDYKLYIEAKKPYRIIKEKDNDSSSFHWDLWTMDNQCKLIEVITTKQKRKDLKEDIEELMSTLNKMKGGRSL